jgi:hypothetical protein
MAGIAARVKQWPPTGRKGQSKREQALILKTDARSILEFAGPIESSTLSSARDGKAVPYRVIQLLLASLIAYITEVEVEEVNIKKLLAALERIEDTVTATKTNTEDIKYSNNHTRSNQETAARSNSAQLWSKIAARTTDLPPSVTTRMTGASAAPPISRWSDREITVQIKDPKESKTLQQHSSAFANIIQIANAAIAKSKCINNGVQTTNKMTSYITTAMILRSGDVKLHAADAATAEKLKKSREEWQGCLGKSAKVKLPSYEIFLSDIPIASFDILKQ